MTKTETSRSELTARPVVVLYRNDILVAPSLVKQLCGSIDCFEGAMLLLWEEFVYTLKNKIHSCKGENPMKFMGIGTGVLCSFEWLTVMSFV